VPLSKIQTDALRLLAAQRDPESYVAGATPLNRDAPRYSGDIDVFHDREERVASAALSDGQTLEAAGYGVRWIRRFPTMYTAEITRQDAVEKSPGYTPEGLIAEVRRNSNYPAAEWRAIDSTEPIDPKVVTTKLRAALDDAEAFVARMPTDKAGLLFLQAAKVVQPDPDRLDTYQTHRGQRRGQWPSSPEITAAMFERYNKKPNADEPKL
jgi:hypothetical protein